jgi:hypothetical protein
MSGRMLRATLATSASEIRSLEEPKFTSRGVGLAVF